MKNLIVALIRWFYWCVFGKIVQILPFCIVNKLSYLFTPIYYFFARGKRSKIQLGLVKMYSGQIFQKELNKQRLNICSIPDSMRSIARKILNTRGWNI